MHTQPLIDLDAAFPDTGQSMPVLFLGHGSPLNALEDNEFSRSWKETGKALPLPKAILCISAHWETDGSAVTAVEKPKTIHDFSGFPKPLYEVQYPAPGSPALAALVKAAVKGLHVRSDHAWGLDHGAWSVLRRLYPAADIPVVQLSLNQTQPPQFHYDLGQELRSLRRKGVLIVGSGNMVHNLFRVVFEDKAYSWAVDFDETLRTLIEARDHHALIHYHTLGPAAKLAVPSNEHFLPLLYILALQEDGDTLRFITPRVTYGSISMRSVIIGRI